LKLEPFGAHGALLPQLRTSPVDQGRVDSMEIKAFVPCMLPPEVFLCAELHSFEKR